MDAPEVVLLVHQPHFLRPSSHHSNRFMLWGIAAALHTPHHLCASNHVAASRSDNLTNIVALTTQPWYLQGTWLVTIWTAYMAHDKVHRSHAAFNAPQLLLQHATIAFAAVIVWEHWFWNIVSASDCRVIELRQRSQHIRHPCLHLHPHIRAMQMPVPDARSGFMHVCIKMDTVEGHRGTTFLYVLLKFVTAAAQMFAESDMRRSSHGLMTSKLLWQLLFNHQAL
jgi:hypothetical protein